MAGTGRQVRMECNLLFAANIVALSTNILESKVRIICVKMRPNFVGFLTHTTPFLGGQPDGARRIMLTTRNLVLRAQLTRSGS